ncbi:MAG: helix-turn-helix domain-containing protein [Flavobacteriaceae bacterium]
MSTNIRVEKVCQYCNKLFIAKKLSTKYCSHKCNSRAYKAIKKYEKINSVDPETDSDQIVLPTPIASYLDQIQEKEFLTVKETAKLLGVSKSTLYRLIKSGALNAGSLSERTTRIKRTEIDKLFKN